MKFHLTATSMPYSMYDDKQEVDYLEKYIKMLDEAASEGPAYIIDNGKVYVNIFYGSDIAKLAEILREELIVTFKDGKATDIEIYNSWRE